MSAAQHYGLGIDKAERDDEDAAEMRVEGAIVRAETRRSEAKRLRQAEWSDTRREAWKALGLEALARAEDRYTSPDDVPTAGMYRAAMDLAAAARHRMIEEQDAQRRAARGVGVTPEVVR